MLPKAFRLPATTRLLRPRTIAIDSFLLKYAPSPVSHIRCSVVVSKKVDSRATKRNELRRSLILVVAENRSQFPRPLDLLVIVRKGATTLSRAELQEQFLTTLKKESLL